MRRFEVWAPDASTVELAVDGRRSAMTRARRPDWWSMDDAEAGPGSRYGFSVDGGPVRPDPRSASQPDGVDGLSEVVDHGAHEWHDSHWRGVTLAGAVLYELHVGTFSTAGTFDGAVEHLPHLVELGVDAVELLPVCEFPGERGWGYDGVDLFAPHHAYGGPDGLKRFVDTCHRAGIGVVFDVVYNHLGPAGNHLRTFGPYFTERHQTGWGDAVNYDDRGSDEVRRFVIDNALMWLRDYHGDGLRLDAVHAIVDTSALHVLEQLAVEVDALAAHVRRPLFLVAESDRNDPRLVRTRGEGGFGLDAAWADDWHHGLHTVLTGERDGYYADFGTAAELAKGLRQAWVYDGMYSPARGRVHGRSPAGLPAHRFVVATQTHDQVGNRAQGERLAALVDEGRLLVAAALLLTAPFVPMLFMGEEWAASTPFQYFTNHADPELGRAVTDGRRREFAAFGWDPATVPDPQARTTFERSKLDWSELDAPVHRRVLAWYRRLVALRHSHPALTDPDLGHIDTSADEETGLVTVQRGNDVVVLANLGPDDLEIAVPELPLALASDPAVRLDRGRLRLAVGTVAILCGTEDE